MNKTEKLSHIGILLLGISALVVSIWQVQLAQRHNRLSVKPYLKFTLSNTDEVDADWKHKLMLKNSGQGPAIIESIEYTVQGKTVGTIEDAMRLAGFSGNVGPYTVTTHDPGDVIEEKAGSLLLGINDVSMKTSTVDIRIVYKSLYDEVFEEVFSY